MYWIKRWSRCQYQAWTTGPDQFADRWSSGDREALVLHTHCMNNKKPLWCRSQTEPLRYSAEDLRTWGDVLLYPSAEMNFIVRVVGGCANHEYREEKACCWLDVLLSRMAAGGG